MLTLTNNNGTVEIIVDENQINEMIEEAVAELLKKISAITGGPHPESLTWDQFKAVDKLLWDAYVSLKDILFDTFSFEEAAKISDQVWSEYKDIKHQVFSLVKVGV